MAAPSSYTKTAAMGAISLADGTGTPVTLAVPYTRGDLTVGPLGARLNEVVKIEARGDFISAAYGNRIYPQLSFSAWLPNVVGSSTSAPGTLAEFVAGLGAYSANVSTLGSGHPMAVKITLTIEGTSFGDTADETIACDDCICSVSITEGMEGNTISVTAEVLGTIVVTNSTGTITYQQA
jgi:hypothetical protein